MSSKRFCNKCFQQENIRVNFGDDWEAEKEFHLQDWCNHLYGISPELMIENGYAFPNEIWISIAKNFIHHYQQGLDNLSLKTDAEKVRFFLNQLKDSVHTFNYDIKLTKTL